MLDWRTIGFVARVSCPLVVAAGLLLPSPARADDYVNRANALYAGVPTDKRSDLVLLPLLAKMDAPPGAVATPPQAMLLPADNAAWAGVEAWAMAAPQRAVVEALNAITTQENPREAMVFGQPYGAEGVPIELIRARLYTELGDPPMLVGAKYLYLPALDRMASLAHVEATRLAASGDVAGAIDGLIDWLFFARQMADREMFREKRWGMIAMIDALHRVRDVAYVDFRSDSPKLQPDRIRELIKRIDHEKGYLDFDRLTFPIGNRIAADQLVDRTFVSRGGPNEATFAPTLSRLASSDRPLRLFSEAAKWEQVAASHQNWFTTTGRLESVYNDWTARWPLDPFSARMDQPFEYERLDPVLSGVIRLALGGGGDGEEAAGLSVLFQGRQVLLTEAVGTETALGLVGFYHDAHNFPPAVQSIRPRFVPEVDADPLNPERPRGAKPPLEYFVPNKINYRRLGEREEARPHEIRLVKEGVQVRLGDDQFVLYSVGTDGQKSWAENIENTAAYAPNADYLLWPPVLSLTRQHLIETRQLR